MPELSAKGYTVSHQQNRRKVSIQIQHVKFSFFSNMLRGWLGRTLLK